MGRIMGELQDSAAERRIPLEVQWELTWRCNLKCSHCYISNDKTARRELSLDEIQGVMDQLSELGTLFLIFTGGEAMLRPDFFDILKAARKRAFAVVLFSNGTLIGQREAGELARLGVVDAGLSVYGPSAEIHDRIVGVSGAFERTMQAIVFLKKSGVKVTLKSVIMKSNFAHRMELIALAESLGVRYIMDPIVSPRNDGSRDALEERLGVDELVELYAHPHFLPEEMKALSEQVPDPQCYAGRNMAAINPFGDVLPCLQFIVPMGNLTEMSFKQIWDEQTGLDEYRSMTQADMKECADCDVRGYCGICPGLSLLETGGIAGPCPVSCMMAEARKKVAERMSGTGVASGARDK